MSYGHLFRILKLPADVDCCTACSVQVLADLGMRPVQSSPVSLSPPEYVQIMLDGRVVGHVQAKAAQSLVNRCDLGWGSMLKASAVHALLPAHDMGEWNTPREMLT